MSFGEEGIRGVSNRNGLEGMKRRTRRGRRRKMRTVAENRREDEGAVGRVASPGTEKSGSGQTVLRVVGRIVSDPDSRELSQTAFSSETTVGPVYPTVLSSRGATTVRSRWLK